MTPERWQQVKTLFDQALELGADERTSFLIEACGDDDELKTEVESLLETHAEDDDFLETPAVEAFAPDVAPSNSTTFNTPPTQFGRYEVVKPLGQGGMATVYQAKDPTLDRLVAIKVIHPHLAHEANFGQRFLQEAKTVAALRHPGIIQIYDLDMVDGVPFMVMEHLSGGTLKDVLQQQGPFDLEKVTALAHQVAQALDAAHQQEIVHRDLKPANILFNERNDPILTDFGIAKLLTETAQLSVTGSAVGTPTYMAPEQAKGDHPTPQSDLYALGVLLYELITGRVPFRGDSPIAVVLQHLEEQPVAPSHYQPELPQAVEAVILKALAKEPQKRFQTAVELSDQFAQAVQDGGARVTASVIQPPRMEARIEQPLETVELNLPLPATPFLGREKELADIATALADPHCRLLNVIGPGGMGKTRLALKTAEAQHSHFTHGAAFVPLEAVNNAQQIVAKIAEAVDFNFFNARNPKTLLFDFLSHKAMLLVLDNFEHLIEHATLVSELLQHAPNTKVLTTSRERLHLQEEWVMELGGLPIPDSVSMEDLEDHTAIRIFLNHAKRGNVGFSLNEGDLSALLNICRLVDGLPLGIELAAGWSRMLPIAEIKNEIEKNLDFLASNVQNLPERHRSLRAVFDYSWQLLSEDEQSVFQKLCLLPSSFDHQAAAHITDASLPVLMSLLDKSLLRQEGQARYEVPNLLRQFGEEALRQQGARYRQTQKKFCDYFSDFLAQRESVLKSPEQKSALADIQQMLPHLRLAWQWAVDQINIGFLDRSLHPIFLFFEKKGLFREGMEWFEKALLQLKKVSAENDHPTTLLVLRLMTRQGHLFRLVGLNQKSLAMLQKSADQLAMTEHLSEYGFTLITLGTSLIRLSDSVQAQKVFSKALTTYQQIDDPIGMANALNGLSTTNYYFGKLKDALRYCEESLQLRRQENDLAGVASSLNNLGNIVGDQGDLTTCIRHYEESLEIKRELGETPGVASTLNNMGATYVVIGDYEKAIHYHEQSLASHQQMGDRWGIANSLSNIGRCYLEIKQYDKSKQMEEEGLAIRMEMNDIRGIAVSHENLGVLAMQQNDLETAEYHLEQAHTHIRSSGNFNETVTILTELGHINILKNSFSDAWPYLIEALSLGLEVNTLTLTIRAFCEIGILLLNTEHTELAIQSLQLAVQHPATAEDVRQTAESYLKQAEPKPHELSDAIDIKTLFAEITTLDPFGTSS